MLDLKKLEKELDEQLAKETPESLKKWLRGIRLESIIIAYGGDGSFIELENIELKKQSITMTPSNEVETKDCNLKYSNFLSA